ncbi:FlgN protein [Poriferisphaera corsica]|uniref:FlgN protein n=1 Tax=Poriferisphaera corsica TaxID=2528020 RepID=A0A517YR79_9BACT|nr:flagellar protein FlgN [Poriferisphaera corsica]QDU32691.1 FlgN protein [Poriferisphaera corsica]
MDKSIDNQINTLDLILQKQLQLHTSLLDLLKQKRNAIGSSDPSQMTNICELEQEKIHLIKQLENKRQQIVINVTKHLNPQATLPLTMQDIAQYIGGTEGDRLLIRRNQLRQKMEDVRQQASIAKRATESLMRHMQSIVQTITAASSGTASYGDSGVMNNRGMNMSSLNLTA